MMRAKLLLAGAALVTGLVTATPAFAGERSELACVPDSYTADQKAEIDGLLARIDVLSDGGDAAMDSLGMVVMSGAAGCISQFGWSDAEIEPALLHEFGRLLEVGFLRHGELSKAEIAKVDATLAKGNRDTLWTALEAQISQGMEGDTETVSDENATIFGLFIMETGIGLEQDKAEQVGVYLAAKAMQRASVRQFTAAQ